MVRFFCRCPFALSQYPCSVIVSFLVCHGSLLLPLSLCSVIVPLLCHSLLPGLSWFASSAAVPLLCHSTLARLEMSNLNNDLVNRHLSTDPKCSCGYSRETAEHYPLHCPNYINIRARTILTLPSSQTNIRTLLYGNLDLRLPENKHIFLTVHEFIKLSKRL